MHVPKLPFRSIIVASSTGSKTALTQNLILNVYRNSFVRIFIFSSSVHNDPTLTEVKKYIRDELQVDDEKEQIYFDNYIPSDLENVIERQKKIINYMKSKKIKKLHSILIVTDDHADDPKFVRYSKLLGTIIFLTLHITFLTPLLFPDPPSFFLTPSCFFFDPPLLFFDPPRPSFVFRTGFAKSYAAA